MKKITLSLCVLLIFSMSAVAQEFTNDRIAAMIEEYRDLDRGPYKRIEWFCEDGTQRGSKDPCPDAIGGGIQHASYKAEIEQLARRNHIYFGEILAAADLWSFWDGDNDHSRLKQYQINNYLVAADNGWIQEKSRFYRGAKQIEDEEEWGRKFYYTILGDDDLIDRDFFLLRESLRDLPHDGDTNLAQEVRSISKTLAEKHPKFMDLRIKIHGNPEAKDIASTQEWVKEYNDDLTFKQREEFEKLIDVMQEFFEPVPVAGLQKMVADWDKDSYIRKQAELFSSSYTNETEPSILIPAAASLMCDIRSNIKDDKRGTRRTSALELSLRLEELIFQTVPNWEPNTLQEHLDKVYAISEALAAGGYVEQWEWDAIEPRLFSTEGETIKAHDLLDFIAAARSQVEWGTGMVNAIYGDVVEEYVQFEPLAYGFYDDRIRSSLLLPLGDSIGELGGLVSRQIGLTSQVENVSNPSTVRGLNAGYAKGELVVVEGNAEGMTVDPNKIYIFDRPPSDLKPVAGIATVSEGNLVSHVQLLARNLGIPNAAISTDNLSDLKKFNGKEIFYAVSGRGTVVIKSVSEMSDVEKGLFTDNKKEKKTIRIPEGKLKLDGTMPLNMSKVSSSDSGILSGPKAANLGQLKQLFPEHVVNGIVIPFGVFRDHMNQQIPGQGKSYWQYLTEIFNTAKSMRDADVQESSVIKYQLAEFTKLRAAINEMPMKPAFIGQLESDFKTVLGDKIGSVPVFLRSDTNMEDLEEFTGAGLNLTVFNAVERDKIIQGIRDVWASPYTERSFKWRQAYLENPENVYPSILIIPTVDVDYSGVLITKDFINNDDNKVTVAMSRGAGGAVDGQSAETYLIDQDGKGELISPARENKQRKLPVTGGSVMEHADFNSSILTNANLITIKQFAEEAHKTMPGSKNGTYDGAWDIELGFKDGKLYLFQIRPFVENDQAKNSEYLSSIDSDVNLNTQLYLNKNIKN
ncbi:Pyruvate phosphate dikinase, PEP/pyruvate binding domain [Nonlabens sp. Hel1_33_55]|uniref:PEP/pyruvate-binding domain-containing protein n=1 Tax=Nonlabens sp. Hel1_33_55 TaxID=1336802 RepID=UPI000875D5E9|nr:PEP/pyruvate-binding domain-containing protein [Nonlabens sp. Hel1_33_55]SCY40130.1 Pyruvate phosphate dikinase, PEP/pyruvate binding domain [Nonlabens sp. Hel1_33_55]